ncbi:MAG TPA: large conductance mechanosensitive channel protein MscL [Tepidisphaeraceae bacterium]
MAVSWKPVVSFWDEFKGFAFKGNMIDLAVAVVIGAAFKTVIDAVVSDIIMPIISVVTPHLPYQEWHIWRFPIGHLLNQLLNFLIVAFAVFITVVKLSQTVMKRASRPAATGEPTTKECPYCLSVIPAQARKCAHCTADLEPAAESGGASGGVVGSPA